MTTEAKPGPRERLLEATATLTYRDGVGIGVEALCKAAGVSKRSMYQLFDSKDELLAASLERGASAYVARLLPGSGISRDCSSLPSLRDRMRTALLTFPCSPRRGEPRVR